MKQPNTNNDSSQMRWVAILLIVAVVLPTLCLLWFMVQAAGNESLALRQKMVNNYEKRLKASAKEKVGYDEINSRTALVMSNGFLVFDGDKKLTFPVDNESDPPDTDAIFDYAFELEYNEKDLEMAIAEYDRIAKEAADKDVAIKADISIIRCLRQIDRDEEAIDLAKSILTRYEDSSKYIRSQKCYAHLLLLDLCKDTGKKDYNKIMSDAFDHFAQGMYHSDDMAFLGRKSHTGLYIPSSLQLLALNRIIENTGRASFNKEYQRKSKYVVTLSSQVNISTQLATEYSTPDFVKPGIKNSRIFRLKGQEAFYGIYKVLSGYTYLKIYSKDRIAGWLDKLVDDIEDEMVYCRIFDDKGDFIAGTEPVSAGDKYEHEQKFLNFDLDSYLAGWKVELFFYSGIFSDAAKRQKIIYYITGSIIVILIGTASALAGKALIRQARVNRLKNDFVATVSHELKTPLASMRVLVDTVLEGNYRDQTQVREYLELVAKENKRLTGLIDNFLTFSRMERNKQSFCIVPTSAKQIADDAADAVGTRFEQSGCKLKITIDEQLPSIDADHDAMVTVLVNLLDNAWKYSSNDKKIEFSVYAKDSSVCFAVKDNGDGMTRRTARKIFDRFYQADSSLARKTEGCGLGLSIVKFIVNAHGGTIEVDSETGKGSLFRVKIPT